MKHQITLSAAIEMTTRFRENRDTVLKEQYQASDLLPLCETFDKESVNALLSETGAAKLRIYYGMDEELKVHAILVAADAEDADILPASASNLTGDPIIILEDAQRCPPFCPPASVLNDDTE